MDEKDKGGQNILEKVLLEQMSTISKIQKLRKKLNVMRHA